MPDNRQQRSDVFRRYQPAGHSKILRLSAALLLVLFMMYRARDPAVWAWMFPPEQDPVAEQKAEQNAEQVAEPNNENIDTSRPLPAGLFNAVEDDTLFRTSDRLPFFTAMEWLQEQSQADITAASAGKVAYAQLFQQPDHYRGQLVTVTGTLRQVSTRTRSLRKTEEPGNAEDREGNENAAEADVGAKISRWHEFYLQPDDHRSEPILIYALTLPEGYPEAGRMRQPARITGVFFKRLVYGAADEPALAPLLLAKQVELTGPALQSGAEESTIELIVISGVIALLAAAIFMFAYRRLTSRNRSAERSAEAILARLESRRGE